MIKFAKPEEIQYAHSILLKDKPYFEQDKIDIIECNESRDVKACPGSGKTTTLLAKLIILANRMPLPNNQGICVLTHTNVAIDEIKNKLGHKADILFKYPNHFGTIQSFVDKFLAIPIYKTLWGSSPKRIDNDLAYDQIKKAFSYKTFDEKKSIYAQIKDRLPNTFPPGKKTDIINSFELELILNLWVKFDINTSPIFYRNYKDEKPIAKTKGTNTYLLFESTRYAIFNKGIISYNDAYSLALHYIDKFPVIGNAFSSRFKYLFIDEMQDTDIHQLDVIEKLFYDKKTIIQRFGDPRQAIYHNKVSANEQWKIQNPLTIKDSKRFGENIAKILRYVCCEENNTLTANPDITSLHPVMIVFEKPENVLPKFCELLSSKHIGDNSVWETSLNCKNREDTSHKIKAIGWVGTDGSPDKLTIKSYFPNFNKHTKAKDKVDYDSLKSFLRKQTGEKVRVTDYSNKIVEALLHILSLGNKKYDNGKTNRNYTKTTLLEDFEDKSSERFMEYKINIAKWSRNIHNSETYCSTTIEEIRTYIKSVFCPLFAIDTTIHDINNFIDNNTENLITDASIRYNNVYKRGEIEIEVTTIHSVKGETHVATLYLETSYHKKTESLRIENQLAGNYYEPADAYEKETLKMAHVGMSRPKHFLCMAIRQNSYKESFDIKNGGMWEIVNA
ncbi:MAG: UvrD-helicase domain-containing protein [Dysgonamonadaceae bacterium]|jgi:hypothetical protein|nr:UvrD-helicase domain-containing protein [Dysgonamonadaceae bacterium]